MGRWACDLVVAVAAAMLVGCGGGTAPAAASPPMPTRAAAGTDSLVTPTASALMDWAATRYPQYFSGQATDGQAAIAGYGTFSYRYWPDTHNYIGLLDGAVYVYGPVSSYQIMSVGTMGNFGCQVADCTVPPAPVFSSSSPTAAVGQTVVLSWSAPNASSCSAAGGWTGSLPATGSQAVTLAATGPNSYSIGCTGPGGQGSAALAVIGQTARQHALGQVQSFAYVIGSTATESGLAQKIASTPAQLIMVGGFAENTSPAFARNNIDPQHRKLILGYVDAAESTVTWNPELFMNGTVPSWFGAQEPFYGLWTVQFWNPAWEAILFKEIDNVIAQGYDGIMLDVLYGDVDWSVGNVFNNPANPNASQAMATLIRDIVSYVRSKNLPNFYLIGSNPSGALRADPSSLAGLDAVLFDGMFYDVNTIGVNRGSALVDWYAQSAQSYRSLGLPIFAVDYPPVGNTQADAQAFSYALAQGWIPSINPATQNSDVLSTGPFLFTANAGNSAVVGASGAKNFIAAGASGAATLTGGDQGDVFIGGPGTNAITGGAGDDLVYAHPASALNKNKLVIDVSSTIKGAASTPTISVTVNGTVVTSAVPVTVAWPTPQQITIDASAYPAISSVVLTVANTSYVDSNNFSNLEVDEITLDGERIDLGGGSYPAGMSVDDHFHFTNAGTVTFPGSLFSSLLPVPADNASTIDGGGGTNTVVYWGPVSNYTVTKQADGSYLVTSQTTAEGPDVLRKIQVLQFSDGDMNLN